jgi:hypothetical protein
LTPDIDTPRSIAARWRQAFSDNGFRTLSHDWRTISRLAATIGGEALLWVLAAFRFLVWPAHRAARTQEAARLSSAPSAGWA